MFLSLVIPIYKVERYISICLNSILPQISRDDVELILIDDGTPDNSALIAEKLIKNFRNAYLYHQTNQGLSCARNNGLSKAKGDYVWFIDSDDSIKKCIPGIMKTLKKENPDLLQLNYQKTFEDGRNPIPGISKLQGKSSGKEVISKGYLPAPAQFTIYKRDFLLKNSLSFIPGIFHEDSEFKPRATYLANSIYIYPPIVYNYLQRESGSIMSSFKYKNAHDIILGINSLLDFSEKYINESDCKIGLRRIIGMNFNTLIYGMRKMNNEDRDKTLYLIKTNSHILREMMMSHKVKYILESILFSLNVNAAVKLYSIFK